MAAKGKFLVAQQVYEPNSLQAGDFSVILARGRVLEPEGTLPLQVGLRPAAQASRLADPGA